MCVVVAKGAPIVETLDKFGITAGSVIIVGSVFTSVVAFSIVISSIDAFSINSELVTSTGIPVLTVDPRIVDILVANVSKLDVNNSKASVACVAHSSVFISFKSVKLPLLVIPASEDQVASILFVFSNVDDSYLAVLSFDVASVVCSLYWISLKVLNSVLFALFVTISVSKFLIELVLVIISLFVASDSKLVTFSVAKFAPKPVALREMSVF